MTAPTVVHPEGKRAAQESPFVSRTKPPEPFTLILFGATGDLAGRKLLPALASLWKNEYLPPEFVIAGIGRRDKTDQVFRDDVLKNLAEFRANEPAASYADFLSHVFYQRTDFTNA